MATALPVPGPACRSPKGELLLWEPLPVLTTIDTRDRLAATIGEVKGWLSDRSAHLPRLSRRLARIPASNRRGGRALILGVSTLLSRPYSPLTHLIVRGLPHTARLHPGSLQATLTLLVTPAPAPPLRQLPTDTKNGHEVPPDNRKYLASCVAENTLRPRLALPKMGAMDLRLRSTLRRGAGWSFVPQIRCHRWAFQSVSIEL